MPRTREVIDYWVGQVGPARWYASDEALDGDIRARFLPDWEAALEGALNEWTTNPAGALAFLIVTDQFPRNMFRDTWRAFASDPLARAAAKKAIENGFDTRIAQPERQFFYLPLMHSECLMDQDRCVRLILTRMPETGADNLVHAKAHREVIRRFGRFPSRNAALHRGSSPEEQAFMASGGYGKLVDELRAG